MLLPLNSKLENDLRSVQQAVRGQPDWPELLDTRSTFKLLYALQIVEIEMQPKDLNSVKPFRSTLAMRCLIPIYCVVVTGGSCKCNLV